jgi:tetratricopeptide (TPR) repeat protein/TolB-like protein
MTIDPSVTRTALPEDCLVDAAAEPEPAATVANRYDLIAAIGRGGMGRVFRAYDRSLKREVAIKVLAPDLALNVHFSQHMMREARAVAQLQHSGIASVYDVVDDGGTLYLVMELLHGETLATRLHARPLSPREAVDYGRQIADALAHAHARGIVHCDLKPANIFLTEDDQIKVVDFGLARALKEPATTGVSSEGIGASPTLVHGRGGTPRYMAPEQALGQPLDHRADIYSFGHVLQEMFQGTPPAAVAPMLQRALAPDPAARYQTVDELKTDLQRVPTRDRGSWPSTSALVAGALVLLVAALLGVLGLVKSSSDPNAAVPVLGVPRFASNSPESSMSFLAAGLSDLVAADLGSTNAVVAAPSAVVVRAPDEAARLARELGAGTLVLGTVDRNDGRVSVAVRLFKAGNSSFTTPTVFTQPAEDLLGIQRALATSVHEQLTAAGIQVRASPRQFVTTQRLLPETLTSFEEYAQARRYLERTDVEADIDNAMIILNRVVAREPNFALARAALGEATWLKWQATKDPAWSEAARGHAIEALRLSADLPEVRYAVALIYQGTGHRAEALAELERVALARPFNDDVQRAMGRLYSESGQVEKGLQSLNRAIALRPGYWGNYAALGGVAYRAGRYEEAIKAFQKYCDLRPDSASAHQRLGTAYHAAGNIEAALASYERALQISPNANAYSNVGTIHFDARRYGAAAKAYEQATELEPRNASLQRNLGDALTRLGDRRGAAKAYDRVIVLATDALRVNPKDASTLSLKAVALARTGRLAEADAASALAVTLAPADNDVLYEHALVLTLRGRKDEALDALRRAVAAGYSAARLNTDPDLASLAALPAFRQLAAGPR